MGACRYLELEGSDASHMKTTLVRQGARSRYVLTEAALGGALSRHDLGIEQVMTVVLGHNYAEPRLLIDLPAVPCYRFVLMSLTDVDVDLSLSREFGDALLRAGDGRDWCGAFTGVTLALVEHRLAKRL